jgi:DNA-directed RNA polymerase subunit RPC12/RpoP
MSTNRPTHLVTCPRCDSPLTYGGTKQFHEGTRAWDFLGGVFELLKHREAFDLYVCSRCGRVEFFLDGVGEELRGE